MLDDNILNYLNYESLSDITKALGLSLPSKNKTKQLIYRIVDLIERLQFELNDILSIANGFNIDLEISWCLLVIVKASGTVLKDVVNIKTASSTAISILNAARVSFSGMNLSGIRIPNADLSNGIFDSTNFTDADLSEVNLQGAWLGKANFKNALMDNVNFGERPCIQLSEPVECYCYSKNNNLLIIASGIQIIFYDTENLNKIKTFRLKGIVSHIYNITISLSGEQLAFSNRYTVFLWNIVSGKIINISYNQEAEKQEILLKGAANQLDGMQIYQIPIDFSPTGEELASAHGSTIRIWNCNTGEEKKALQWNTDDYNLYLKLDFPGSTDEYDLCFKLDFPANMSSLRTGMLAKNIYLEKKENKLKYVVVSMLNGTITGAGVLDINVSDDLTQELLNNKKFEILEIISKRGHIDPFIISIIVFHPNNQKLASSGTDYTIYLWNLTSGKIIKKFNPPEIGVVNNIIFTKNTQQLVISIHKKIYLWNYENDIINNVLEFHRDIVAGIALSYDEKQLVSISTDLCIWDLETQKLKKFLQNKISGYGNIIFSHDGKEIICSKDHKTIQILKITEDLIKEKSLKYYNIVESVVSSLDGKQLFSLSIYNGNAYINLWNNITGMLENTFSIPLSSTIAFIADNGQLASSYHGNIKLYGFAVDNPNKIYKFRNAKGSGCYLYLTYTPDEKLYELCKNFKYPAFILNYDKHNNNVKQLILVNKYNKLEIILLQAAEQQFFNDIIINMKNVRLEDKIFLQFEHPIMKCIIKKFDISSHYKYEEVFAFSRDREQLAAVVHDNITYIVYLLDSKNNEVKNKLPHNKPISSLTFSHSGQLLVTNCELDSSINLWDCYKGEIIKIFKISNVGRIITVIFSLDEKQLVCSYGNKSRYQWWDHTYSWDNIYRWDHIYVWNIADGSYKNFKGHTRTSPSIYIRSISFSPNGKLLVSCSLDKTIRIWEYISGKNIYTIKTDDPINSVIWVKVNNNIIHLVSGGFRTICAWNVIYKYEHGISVYLLWSNNQDHLYVNYSNIERARLSLGNINLLKQGGAIGNPLLRGNTDHYEQQVFSPMLQSKIKQTFPRFKLEELDNDDLSIKAMAKKRQDWCTIT